MSDLKRKLNEAPIGKLGKELHREIQVHLPLQLKNKSIDLVSPLFIKIEGKEFSVEGLMNESAPPKDDDIPASEAPKKKGRKRKSE